MSAVLLLMSSSDYSLCSWKSTQIQKWAEICYVNMEVGFLWFVVIVLGFIFLVGVFFEAFCGFCFLGFLRAQNHLFLTFPAPLL